jgi:hypothetical protein
MPTTSLSLAGKTSLFGTHKVIELGDGQVSDRPSTIEPAAFLNAILGP